MKGFERKNQLSSLCGLNYGLCPMLLGNYCGGCGTGNQSCRIAKCSLEHGRIEYCYECEQYPCEKYQHIDEYDSFITHRRQKADLERARSIGIERYNLEQQEKIQKNYKSTIKTRASVSLIRRHASFPHYYDLRDLDLRELKFYDPYFCELNPRELYFCEV